uniref:Uncharacterized protein n=1 Tax=Rousettus aegyptiacus TaxID=9407 RepID=A0A7J8FJ31_ROUAE|nr:hypothetical protein HJG63_012127 [Rousettus aegyptiacus]
MVWKKNQTLIGKLHKRKDKLSSVQCHGEEAGSTIRALMGHLARGSGWVSLKKSQLRSERWVRVNSLLSAGKSGPGRGKKVCKGTTAKGHRLYSRNQSKAGARAQDWRRRVRWLGRRSQQGQIPQRAWSATAFTSVWSFPVCVKGIRALSTL